MESSSLANIEDSVRSEAEQEKRLKKSRWLQQTDQPKKSRWLQETEEPKRSRWFQEDFDGNSPPYPESPSTSSRTVRTSAQAISKILPSGASTAVSAPLRKPSI
uniref:Uncharacterized protein n=1 Tax=Erythrolobus madagascarensis TaxID=708628 RepID=A0A7S0XJY2_9RHOD